MNTVHARATVEGAPQGHPADDAVQVRIAPEVESLTAEQVCDLPLPVLLARTNAKIGKPVDLSSDNFADVDTSYFFGYLVSRPKDATLHIRSDATEIAHDVYVRYLIAMHLGLPTDLFPPELSHTVFVGPNLDEVAA